jgi:hypothetical protein
VVGDMWWEIRGVISLRSTPCCQHQQLWYAACCRLQDDLRQLLRSHCQDMLVVTCMPPRTAQDVTVFCE